MSGKFLGGAFDRAGLERLADGLAVAVVVALPWSTTATGVCIVLWLLALLPTLDVGALRRELSSAAGGLPVLLWAFAILGLAWGQVSFAERLAGVGGYNKLLIIPLLFTQFRRSERGLPVLYGFLGSCVLLLAVSWVLQILWILVPEKKLFVPGKLPGVPVKDYVAQSTEFLVCGFALLAIAMGQVRAQRLARAAGLALLAVLFFVNILYAATGRTALVVVPILLLIFGLRELGWKGTLGIFAAGTIVVAAAWASSPFLRERVLDSFNDVASYRTENTVSSSSLRIEFWKKSLAFIAAAPVIGHGTGMIPKLFRDAAVNETGPGAFAAVNPHNQYFAVAIELGLVGLAILISMWVAHLALFRGGGIIAWIGLVVVLQNIVSSLFNSHLFDFFHGWFYVFGVGVLGGMVLRQRRPPAAATPEAR